MTTSNRPRAWNSTLPARSAGLPRTPFTRSTEMPRGTGFRRPSLALVEGSAAPVLVLAPQHSRRRRTDTGFSQDVKLAVRKRAGNGHAEDARCECCGIWLGRYGGQVQHIVARGMGGTSNPVLKTAANGALLCGTAQSGDHGLAESRDPGMQRKGFWLPQGNDPRVSPMTLWSGRSVWRSEDGGYIYEPPEGWCA